MGNLYKGGGKKNNAINNAEKASSFSGKNFRLGCKGFKFEPQHYYLFPVRSWTSYFSQCQVILYKTGIMILRKDCLDQCLPGASGRMGID